jgi:hypothetical protein
VLRFLNEAEFKNNWFVNKISRKYSIQAVHDYNCLLLSRFSVRCQSKHNTEELKTRSLTRKRASWKLYTRIVWLLMRLAPLKRSQPFCTGIILRNLWDHLSSCIKVSGVQNCKLIWKTFHWEVRVAESPCFHRNA